VETRGAFAVSGCALLFLHVAHFRVVIFVFYYAIFVLMPGAIFEHQKLTLSKKLNDGTRHVND
jgi:hypothetical protein